MIHNPHTLDAKSVIEKLGSNVEYGLDKKEVIKRFTTFGKNLIPKKGPKKRYLIFFDQFKDPIIYILAVATLLAFLFRNWLEGIAILIVILITVMIGFFMELQAIRSLKKLRKLGQTASRVLRNGKVRKIRASSLVPGDIILLETGDIVTADARLITVDNLEVKEATLTGESTPMAKHTKVIAVNTSIFEQANMVFKGTMVVKGIAKAIVVATGIDTELGKIQQMGMQTKKSHTPLEKKLKELSKWLIWLTLFMALLIVIAGFLRGKELILMIQTGVALAVATVPEGLPIVATIALAQGMVRLSKRNVIIKKLEAVQTMGATNIICTDKTGTLTEDRIKVHTLLLGSGDIHEVYDYEKNELALLKENNAFDILIRISTLCNSVLFLEGDRMGDTIDLSLMEFAEQIGYDPVMIQESNPEQLEIAFDTENKMMTTVNLNKEGFYVYTKGAFESIITHCKYILSDNKIIQFKDKELWYDKLDKMASQGLRTLAFAFKRTKKLPSNEELLKEMTFAGIIGFLDPARQDVKSTITTYKNAGIRVVMMTGDHPGTAMKIAQDVGMIAKEQGSEMILNGNTLNEIDKANDDSVREILKSPVFARVTPKQKLDLISFYQQTNNIVGMIGDGINDVPALMKADIGIAMGIRGTEAAREAADIILKDDKFTTIELAIRQGRAVYQNIRQFVVYLLSSNLAEIISVGLAALLNLPSPLMPLQILFLNLITDIFPALALGLGKGEEDIMELPPNKPDEPIMTRKHWNATVIYGLSITASVLGISMYSNYVLELAPEQINNMAFFTLIFAQLLNVFNMPLRHLSFFRNEVTTNPWIWAAIVFCILLTTLAYLLPPVANVLSLGTLTYDKIILVMLFGLGSLAISQFIKRVGGAM
jgi:Ca2+-transporting ATPase